MGLNVNEVTTLEQIRLQLEGLTVGLDEDGKKKYIKDLGYDNYNQIRGLSDLLKRELLERLLKMSGKKYVQDENNGYKITRPEKPTKVSEISFSIRGVKL